MFSFLFGLVRRAVLYQFFFIFAYLKLRDISGSSYELKDKFYELSTQVNFKHPLVDKFFADPIVAFQVYLAAQTIVALLALLGSKFFSFLSGLFLTVTTVLYFNPLRVNPQTKQYPQINLEFVKNLSAEFVVLTALTLAVFAHSWWRPSKAACSRSHVDSAVFETPDSKGRNANPSSLNKKKRI